MLASFSMAFYHTSIRAQSLINNVSYKFNINAYKLHLSRRQLSTKSKQSSHKRGRNGSLSTEPEHKIHNLADYIAFRKFEARKSIIVQIESWKSFKELLSYCSQFGDIANVFHYILPKDHHFVLLEYKQMKSAKEAISGATYTDKENIVPSRTNIMWFRKISENIASELKMNNISRISPWTNILLRESTVIKSLANAYTMSSQIMTLYNEYRLSELEIRLKFQIIATLEDYFSGIFPSVIIHPFGSFINGFGKKSSDLDVVLFADGLKKENKLSKLVFHSKSVNVNEKQQTHEFMGVLADTMKYMIPGISGVRKIFNARVPIIKFNNLFMHTECDLSASNVIATYMTELLYLYGQMDNRVRPLVFTVRKWALDNKLTSPNPGRTITNFSLTLLVIFFLQQQQILPCINQMKGFEETITRNNEFLDNIYLHNIHDYWTSNTNKEFLHMLLLNFFKYYSTFKFCENEICLRQGRTLEKRSKQPLFIHNPFQQELNVSKNVAQSEVDRLQSLMVIAISNLENTKVSKSTNWGILSILNVTEPPKVNVKDSQISVKEYKSTSENQEISENSDRIESIQENNVDNALSVEQDVVKQV